MKVRHGHAYGAPAEMGWHGHAKQHGQAVSDFWNKIWIGVEWHGRTRGHGYAMPRFRLGVLEWFDFLVEFLCCVLVGDCVWLSWGSFVD